MKGPVRKLNVSNLNHRHKENRRNQEQILTLSDNDSIEQTIIQKFRKEGFESLTIIQQKALPVIARRINCLLVAATGSGKTEAAVLPVLSMLSKSSRTPGKIRAIYITPLRALNNDVYRRIVRYAESENLRVEIRHGDTTAKVKRTIVESPPDILITTPESLGVVLSSERMIIALQNLEWIIIDEVHELISNERGAHLTIGLERLQAISSERVTRVGLSASLGNLREAGKFISGTFRKHAILLDRSGREYDIHTQYVKGSFTNVAHFIIEYIISNRVSGSVLLFTNTRDEAEHLATVLKNQTEVNVDVHHGSLSREMRQETEQKLRVGAAGVVVCTSSLELGLDIGSIELVMHYGSPRQVSKLVQRVGRSRHRQTTYAKGLIVTNNPDDELEALAIIRRMKRRWIEEQTMHSNALDVVAHHLVGLALQRKGGIELPKAFDVITKAYPFSRISINDFQSCVEILDRNGIIKFDREAGTYHRRIKSYRYYFDNLSMIPHVLKFEVIDSIAKRRVGTLDQQFVEDYAEKGNVFVLKGSQWRILSIDEKKMQVNVEPLRGVVINVPYWVGEMIPVDFITAQEVGIVRQHAMRSIINLSTQTLQDSISTLGVIPDSNNVVIESSATKNTVVVHSMFGTKVNNTIACLLSTILSSQLGYLVETRSDPYRIMLTSNARIGKAHIENVLKDSYAFESVIIASFTGTHIMNWKVWAVAKRFGMINRDALYDKKVARMIYERYSRTAISKEAIRELMHDKYDLEKTKNILQRLQNGCCCIHWIEVTEFSELAQPILEHLSKFSANPLSVERGIIELVKERLEKTKHRLICIRCGKWERTLDTIQSPENISCHFCRSRLITATFSSDNELAKIISKRLNGSKLLPEEERRFDRAWKVASLINNFGRKALLVLAGYGIGADTAARILRNYIDDDGIYKSVYEAERQYVLTRGFWND
ncbi:MAG TPA: DEAD/DEAH box helicase [Candidatus Bathyarchaeia archaeon]|nr:DEAD/DEAH box helicase [Candidatus Bathyarchaeia archaeon]